MRIHKGDMVKIMVGKDKGKSGKVITVNSAISKVVIDGLNLYKKHVKPKKQGEKGELISVPRPLTISNVAMVCGDCKKPTRLGYKIEGKKKIRICKKCQAKI